MEHPLQPAGKIKLECFFSMKWFCSEYQEPPLFDLGSQLVWMWGVSARMWTVSQACSSLEKEIGDMIPNTG